MKLLVIDKDWADEFSIFGMAIMDDTQYDLWDKAIKALSDKPLYWNFGSNEGYEDNTYGEFFGRPGDIKIQDLTDAEAEVFLRLFPRMKLTMSSGVGQCPFFDVLETNLSEEEEPPEVDAFWDYLSLMQIKERSNA